MLDAGTVIVSIWFAIITLILVLFLEHIENHRMRILLPLISASVPCLLVILGNPLLDSGYRGQMEYLGPFLFPIIIPLLTSVPLILLLGRRDSVPERAAEFAGAGISAFLFLTLYQSGLLYQVLPPAAALTFLFGSVLIFASLVFFASGIALSGGAVSRKNLAAGQNAPLPKDTRGPDRYVFSLLALWLLASLFPMYLIDFANNHDRSTMGQLHLYVPDPAEIPEGRIIHLNGSLLQEYPQLGVLMNSSRVYRVSLPLKGDRVNVTDLGEERISCNTEMAMRNDGIIWSGASDPAYLEYGGKRYVAGILHYAGEECVRVSIFG